MIDVELFLHGVVLVSGVLGAVGAGYLLYADTVVVHYTAFFRLVAAGLLLFSVSAPIIVQFAPDAIHALHAISALFIAAGLYTLIRGELEADADFARLENEFARDGD